MAGLMTPSLGSFVPVGETEERTQRLARAAEQRRLAESTRQFDVNQKLARDTFNENVRQFGLGYALDQQRLAENTRQFDLGYGLDERRLAESGRQFDVSQKLARDTFNENVRQFGLDYAIREAEANRIAELFGRDRRAYEALQGMELGAPRPNVPLTPQDTRPPLVSGMDSSGIPTVTVPLTEGPSTTTATAGLSVPGVDLTPTSSPYNRYTTRALVDEYIRQKNVAQNARGPNASGAKEAADALFAELQARGVGKERVDDIRKWSELTRQKSATGNRFRQQGELDELEKALDGIDLDATGPSESAALGGALDLGAFTATGRTADALTSPGTPVGRGDMGEIQFDVSNRRGVLDATRASLENQFRLAQLQGDAAAAANIQAAYNALLPEETLLTGMEALQAASMGNIEPLRQFLAKQYIENLTNQSGEIDLQIYQNFDGTLDIRVDGRSLGRTTLGAIRQKLLADLDPATQQASAAATKYQQELFLKLAPEILKQQVERGDARDLKFIDLGSDQRFFTYARGNRYFMRPLVEVTVGGQTAYKLGEEQPFSGVR